MSAHGRAGQRTGGLEGANRRFATGRQILPGETKITFFIYFLLGFDINIKE